MGGLEGDAEETSQRAREGQREETQSRRLGGPGARAALGAPGVPETETRGNGRKESQKKDKIQD